MTARGWNLGIGLVALILAGQPEVASVARAQPSASVDQSPAERSVYLLESQWVNDSGKSLRLQELQGNYQVLAFIFTQCASACPLLVKAMQLQAKGMPEERRKRMRFLLITMDPDHDTPEVLRRYREKLGLESTQWTLLRGTQADVRELAAVVNFNYERIEGGHFIHSNLVTLLDPAGEIVHQQTGASDDWSALTEAIRNVP